MAWCVFHLQFKQSKLSTSQSTTHLRMHVISNTWKHGSDAVQVIKEYTRTHTCRRGHRPAGPPAELDLADWTSNADPLWIDSRHNTLHYRTRYNTTTLMLMWALRHFRDTCGESRRIYGVGVFIRLRQENALQSTLAIFVTWPASNSKMALFQSETDVKGALLLYLQRTCTV